MRFNYIACCYGCGYCHRHYSTQLIRLRNNNPFASFCFLSPSSISYSSAYSSSSKLDSSPLEYCASAKCPPSDSFSPLSSESSSFSETASSAISATAKSASSSSIDPKELQNFKVLSKQWSNENDSFKALHSLNQLRIPWIVETINKYSRYNNENETRTERNTTKTNKLVEGMRRELDGSRCKSNNMRSIICSSNVGMSKARLIDLKEDGEADEESMRISDKKKKGASDSSSLTGMRIVDVGCGGGLLSIPLARLGVTHLCGIDASEEAIRAARYALSSAFHHRHKQQLKQKRDDAEKKHPREGLIANVNIADCSHTTTSGDSTSTKMGAVNDLLLLDFAANKEKRQHQQQCYGNRNDTEDGDSHNDDVFKHELQQQKRQEEEQLQLGSGAASLADVGSGKNIELLCTTVEKFAVENAEGFDAVIASEIIEHVANMDSFVGACAQLAKPGAPIFFTTINKTLASRFFAIWLAENVFGVVPQGIHDWTKFVKPDELRQLLEANDCEVRFLHGLSYNPFTNSWSWTSSTAINYALIAIKRSKHNKINNLDIDCN